MHYSIRPVIKIYFSSSAIWLKNRYALDKTSKTFYGIQLIKNRGCPLQVNENAKYRIRSLGPEKIKINK